MGGPCLCGDPGCPSCGPAQGYNPRRFSDEFYRCMICGRFLPEENLQGICDRSECQASYVEEQFQEAVSELVMEAGGLDELLASVVFSNDSIILEWDFIELLVDDDSEIAVEAAHAAMRLLEMTRNIHSYAKEQTRELHWKAGGIRAFDKCKVHELKWRAEILYGWCLSCGKIYVDDFHVDHPDPDDPAISCYCTPCAIASLTEMIEDLASRTRAVAQKHRS